jgi:hypothetical protein
MVACALAALGALWGAGCRAVLPEPAVERPAWVREAEHASGGGRFLAATGSARASSAGSAGVQADRVARRRLAAEAEAHVARVTTAFLNARGEYPSPESPVAAEFSRALQAEVAGRLLRRAEAARTWQAPDGDVHVLYQVPMTRVNAQIAASAASAAGYANPFGQSLPQATEQIEEFLAALLEQQLAAASRDEARPAEAQPPARGPAWLTSGRTGAYPRAQYLSAMGLGADLRSAEQEALGELASRVAASISALARATGAPDAEGPLAANLRWLDPAALRFETADLTAARVAERWHDPATDTHYALAVLDRTTAALVYRGEIADALARSAERRAAARNHQRAENFAASLTDYVDAVAAARRTVRLQLAALVTAPEENVPELKAIVSEPLLAEAKQGLAALLGSFTLQKTGGDRQWMPPGVAPAEPLAVRLTAGEAAAPLKGVPLRLLSGHDVPEVLAEAETGADGTAEWRLAEPPPSDAERSVLLIEPDLRALSPGADLYRIEVPQAAFDYVLRSRDNSYFVVHVSERIADGRLLPTPLADALAEAIKAEGLRLMDDPALLARLPAGEPGMDEPVEQVLGAFAEVRDALGPGRFLLIVLGEIRLELQEKTQTPEGELFIVYCPYEIKVLDGALPGEQKTVLSINGRGKGAYLGNELEAARRARTEAAAEAAAQLVSGLRVKLGR